MSTKDDCAWEVMRKSTSIEFELRLNIFVTQELPRFLSLPWLWQLCRFSSDSTFLVYRLWLVIRVKTIVSIIDEGVIEKPNAALLLH